ncbi:hypothetical protein [Elizabethkingia anophelis]|uniref:hypothetical protein n=1 Tax=Elizabethkingia anophelis TaxID=1117645 RepID=UPI000A7DB591|nr:hypothetical protein [Elizabethkingia anophelis]
MKARQDIAVFLLRIALAVGFLSAVSSRLNLWGVQSSGWSKFVRYTAEVNSFFALFMDSFSCGIIYPCRIFYWYLTSYRLSDT